MAATRFHYAEAATSASGVFAFMSGFESGRAQRGHVDGRADVGSAAAALAAKSDITLSELREQLRGRGVAIAITTLWRFFKRRKITRKNSRRTRPNSAAAR